MAEGGLRRQIRALLESVERGRVDPGEELERLARLPYDDLGFARFDVHRELRQGAPEAILAEGKEPAEVETIVAILLAAGAGSVLVTRADAEARAAVRPPTPRSTSGPDSGAVARLKVEHRQAARAACPAAVAPSPRAWRRSESARCRCPRAR
jgi:NCAIR mutase (PurE)-related protein